MSTINGTYYINGTYFVFIYDIKSDLLSYRSCVDYNLRRFGYLSTHHIVRNDIIWNLMRCFYNKEGYIHYTKTTENYHFCEATINY